MSDQNTQTTNITPQAEGQPPVENQQVQGSGGTGISPEIETLIKQRVERELQSRTDKIAKLVDAEVSKRLEAAQVPAPQTNQPATVPQPTVVSTSVQTSQQAPVQAPPEADKSMEWAIGFAESMNKREGVAVNTNDPEAPLVDVSDPFKFVETYPKAMEQKKARLAAEAKSKAIAGSTTSTAHGTPSNPIADNWDIDDLYAKGLAKK